LKMRKTRLTLRKVKLWSWA